MSLFTDVCQSGNLCSAYNRFSRYRGLWEPGVPMFSVSAAPVGPMLRLVEDLQTGRYQPHPPKVISIVKADGKRRELRVYAIRDRVVQRALLQTLQIRTDPFMSVFSYGYRLGRGVGDAVARVHGFLDAGLSWVVDADIERCFDSIPRAPLLAEVAKRLDDSAAELVARCLGWHDMRQRMEVGIPQGAVLAPWLCNVYLWRLDDHMSDRNTAMVRFADDFVLLAATHHMAIKTLKECVRAVKDLHLRLHPLKTAVVNASVPFRFLGQWLSTTRLLAATPSSSLISSGDWEI